MLLLWLQIALDKLFRFASSHVFESEVAGLLCADMCAAAGKVLAVCCVYYVCSYNVCIITFVYWITMLGKC